LLAPIIHQNFSPYLAFIAIIPSASSFPRLTSASATIKAVKAAVSSI
jgi:hypothetical protein